MRKLKISMILMLCMILICSTTACTGSKVLTDADIVGEDGRFLYTVIYADDAGDEVADEVNNVSRQLRETFDIRVDRSTDKKEKAKSENYEILIGDTNRDESSKAIITLNDNRANSANDFIVKVIDKKIVINANNEETLLNAIRHFATTYCIGYEEFGKLDKDFEYINEKKYSVPAATIDGVSLSDYVIVTPSQKSLLWMQKVNDFTDCMSKNAGIDIKVVTDVKAETSKEILIGATNRLQSGTLTGDEWNVQLVDKKLVVNGGSDVAIASAMDVLLDLANKATADKKPFEIKKGFAQKGTAEKNGTDYYLAWGDEFNAGKLDRTMWRDYSRNNESKSLTGGTLYRGDARDAYVKDGCMMVPAKRLNYYDFQHGQVTTDGTLIARYGIIEMRVRFADYPATTSLWGNYVDYDVVDGKKVVKEYAQKLELDIVENFGNRNSFAANIHNWFDNEDINGNTVSGHTSLDGGKYASAKKYTYKSKEDHLANSFHVYSVRWTPYEFAFAFDGDVYFTYDITKDKSGTDFTKAAQLFLIGTACGNANYGMTLDKYGDFKYSEIAVDYFRLYQSDQYDNVLGITPIATYTPDLTVERQNQRMAKEQAERDSAK